MWFNRSLLWGWNFFTKERFMFISFDCFLSFLFGMYWFNIWFLELLPFCTFSIIIFCIQFLHYFCIIIVSWLFWDVKFERALILRWLLCCIPKWSAYVCTSASGWTWVYSRSDCQGNWMTLWRPWQQEHLQIVKTPVEGKAGILDLLGGSYVKTRTVKLTCSFSTIIKNRKQKWMQFIMFYDL